MTATSSKLRLVAKEKTPKDAASKRKPRAKSGVSETSVASVEKKPTKTARRPTPKKPCRVSDVMRRDVVTCDSQASLHEIVRLMWEQDLGCVVRVDAHGAPTGVITDRDALMAAYTRAAPLYNLGAEGAIATTLVTISETSSIEVAETLMSRHQVRRLPVVDGAGKLVGLLAFAELVQESRKKRGVTTTSVCRMLSDVLKPPTALASRNAS